MADRTRPPYGRNFATFKGQPARNIDQMQSNGVGSAVNGHANTPATRSPVLFLIFNRTGPTLEVFQAIRSARPPRLYVASDGPRDGRPAEKSTVEELRQRVIGMVDWPCEVKTLFREKNLGCKEAVSGAITWFFDHEQQGIILEDDCLVSPTFFPFCDELLDKHADDPTVGGIAADFRPLKSNRPNNEYGRISYAMIWGWATWRRVWKQYDPTIARWNGDPKSLPRIAGKRERTQEYMKAVFDAVKEGRIDTWDYQFVHLCLDKGMDFLHPFVNMISNLGFDGDATHTTYGDDINARLPTKDVRFPLIGPVQDKFYENWLDRRVFSDRELHVRAFQRLQHWIHRRLNISTRRI